MRPHPRSRPSSLTHPWKRRVPTRRLRLSTALRSPAPEAEPGVPFAGRALYRLLLLGLLVAAAVFLSLATVNVLVLGTDDVDLSQHTDTIILLQWRPLPRQLGLLSVPRDTLVVLPKHGTLKLNEVYAYGKALNGPEYALAMTRATVETLLGVKVHFVLHLRYSDVVQAVDAVGGVPVTVAERMQVADQAGGLNIDLAPGPQVLDGAHALEYLRFRHDEADDLGRVRRQQEFLKAFAGQVGGWKHWPRTVRALFTLLHQVDTDLNVPTALFLALELHAVVGRNWHLAVLPGTSVYLEGKSYWQTEPAAVRACVRDLGRQPRAAAAPSAANGVPAAATTPVAEAPEAMTTPGVESAPDSAAAPSVAGAPAAAPAPAAAVQAPRPVRMVAPPARPTRVTTLRPARVAQTQLTARVQTLRPSGPQPVVRVLNGCGVNGICKPIAQKLRSQGIIVYDADVTNAPNFNYSQTVIKTRSRNLPWAERVAKLLGLPPERVLLVPSTIGYPTVSLVIGRDYTEWFRQP